MTTQTHCTDMKQLNYINLPKSRLPHTGGRYPKPCEKDCRVEFARRWQAHQRAKLGLSPRIANLNENIYEMHLP
jgi:hypothetical protein